MLNPKKIPLPIPEPEALEYIETSFIV